jgi:hypothetical protein
VEREVGEDAHVSDVRCFDYQRLIWGGSSGIGPPKTGWVDFVTPKERQSMNDPREPVDVARRLLEFASSVESIVLTELDFPVSRDEQKLLLNDSIAVQYVRQAEELIGKLKAALKNT